MDNIPVYNIMAPRKRKSKSKTSCATPGKRKIYEGARGGRYYMCKGRKVYLKPGESLPCARSPVSGFVKRVPKGRRTAEDVARENALFDQERAVQQTLFEQQVADANRAASSSVVRASTAGPLIPNAPSAPGGRIRGGGGRMSKKELEDLASRKYRASVLAENKRLMQEYNEEYQDRAPKTDYMGYSIDDQPDFAPVLPAPPRSGPRQDYMGYDIDDSPRKGWFSGWFS